MFDECERTLRVLFDFYFFHNDLRSLLSARQQEAGTAFLIVRSFT